MKFLLVGALVTGQVQAIETYFPTDCPRIRSGTLNNTFGTVRNGGSKNHQGWDFAGELGQHVVSVQDAIVHDVGYSTSYGNFVMTYSDETGLYFFYAHLMSALVKVDQLVRAGVTIGLLGDSGNAKGTEPHVHFEVRSKPYPGRGLRGRFSPFRIFRDRFNEVLHDRFPCD